MLPFWPRGKHPSKACINSSTDSDCEHLNRQGWCYRRCRADDAVAKPAEGASYMADGLQKYRFA